MLSLQLRRSGTDMPVEVLAAEITRPGFRHRLTFECDNSLAEALQPELAEFIEVVLADTIEAGPTVVDQPKATVCMPGLTLGRLRMIVGAPIGDKRLVTVRFRYFIGGIQNAFAARTYFDRPALAHREEIGMRALEDIAVPLLNMAMTARSWSDAVPQGMFHDGMANALGAIEAHAVELEFYAGLLRRYIHECGPGRMAALGQFDDPVLRMMQMAEPPVPALRRTADS